MLFYDAITLRDILSVRMGMFSSSSILSILSDTLIHYLLQWGKTSSDLSVSVGHKAKPSNSENMSNARETSSGVSTV